MQTDSNSKVSPPCTGSTNQTNALQSRARWLRIMTKVHWISSALCLFGMLFFASTGTMLNNADLFESSEPLVTKHSATLPSVLLVQINDKSATPVQEKTLPDAIRNWVKSSWGISLSAKAIDWRAEEVFVDLKRPGVDAWLSIDRKTGMVQYEAEDRGWVAFFNDLHKGKNAGKLWSWLINLFGIGALIFSFTGLLILQTHAKTRWNIWPITGLGLIVPLLVALLFVH